MISQIEVLRDWWMFVLGAIIGVVVKVDEFDKDKNSLYQSSLYKVHKRWLCISLGLAFVKGALVFVGAYIIINSKVNDTTISLVGAGIATMSFDSVWKYIQSKTARQLNNRRNSGVDQDSLF